MAAALDDCHATPGIDEKAGLIRWECFFLGELPEPLPLQRSVQAVETPVAQARAEKDIAVIAGDEHLPRWGQRLHGSLPDEFQGVPYPVVEFGAGSGAIPGRLLPVAAGCAKR